MKYFQNKLYMMQIILTIILLSFIIDILPILPCIIVIFTISLILYDILFNKIPQPEKKPDVTQLHKMNIDFINHPRPRM